MRTRRNILNILFFTMMATALLPLATAQQAPATSDWRNGRIAFGGCGVTNCDVYTLNPDGTALHQVTHDASSFHPDRSPDAVHIAYASVASGFVAIWVADADGANVRQLTPDDPTSFNVWPCFMPDGRTILYTNCLGQGCDGGISAIDIDGTNQRVILTPRIGESYNNAVPSSDGKRLAFMKWHVKGDLMRIYLLRLGTTPERAVTSRELEGYDPDWSPDGTKVLFVSNVNRPNRAIYSIRPDGEDLQQLTYPKFPMDDWSAAYSPNGARIAFTSNRRYPDKCCSDLFTMRADESDGYNDAEGEQRRQTQRIPVPLSYAADPRWGIAPLLTEATVNVSAATANPGAVPPGRATAMRNVCRGFPALARTPLCRK